jgi:hypothetical protein
MNHNVKEINIENIPTGILNILSGDNTASIPLLMSVDIVDNVRRDVTPRINTILKNIIDERDTPA